jgi:hypothetical protein
MTKRSEKESWKKALLEKAKDPKNIPGIYNYCDRWCERCQFTSRCLNYDLDEERNLDELDISNEAFWNKVMETLHTAFDLIRDMAEEAGVDLDEIEPIEEEDDDTVVHILSSLSRNYADMVDQWMQDNEHLLVDEFEKQARRSGLKLVQSRTAVDPVPLKDIIEIIRWYQYQIHVKISRALGSKKDENRSLDDFPKDSDGSAKVALIGIDRSISAWGEMAGYFPEEKEVLRIIKFLTRLREMTEKEFPDARSFKRPGFDEYSISQ